MLDRQAANAPSAAPEQWESLPQIVSLRAGKRFRLMGNVYVASPSFEIATLVYGLTAIVLSLSPNTNPIVLYRMLVERMSGF